MIETKLPGLSTRASALVWVALAVLLLSSTLFYYSGTKEPLPLTTTHVKSGESLTCSLTDLTFDNLIVDKGGRIVVHDLCNVTVRGTLRLNGTIVRVSP